MKQGFSLISYSAGEDRMANFWLVCQQIVELEFRVKFSLSLTLLAMMAVLNSKDKFASHTASKGLAICSYWEMFWNKYSFEIQSSLRLHLEFSSKVQQIEAWLEKSFISGLLIWLTYMYKSQDLFIVEEEDDKYFLGFWSFFVFWSS